MFSGLGNSGSERRLGCYRSVHSRQYHLYALISVIYWKRKRQFERLFFLLLTPTLINEVPVA